MVIIKQSRYNADKFLLNLSINKDTKRLKTRPKFILTTIFILVVVVGVVRRAGRSSGCSFDQRENLHPLRRSARALLQVGAVGAVSTKGRICGGRGGLQGCGRVLGVGGVVSIWMCHQVKRHLL